MARPILSLIACVALASAARADVLVVDPGVDPWHALQDALDASLPGDILLLPAADYTGFPAAIDITARGVMLVSDHASGSTKVPPLQVIGVPAEQTVVLRGLEIHALEMAGSEPPVETFVSPGATLWIEDAQLEGGTSLDGFGIHGLIASQVRLALLRSTVHGGDGGAAATFANAAPAVTISPSAPGVRGAVMDCTIRGGDGGAGQPAHGASGVSCGGDVFVGGSSVHGGDEGAHNDALPGKAGNGLDKSGLGGYTLVFVRDSELAGGSAQGPGTPGVPSSIPPLAFGEYPAAWRTLRLPAIARSHQTAQLRAHGEVGDLVAAVVALDANIGLPLAGKQAPLLLDPAGLIGPVVLGAITAPDGNFELDFVLPQLPPGEQGLRVYAQGVTVGADGVTLGGASAMAWISDAF